MLPPAQKGRLDVRKKGILKHKKKWALTGLALLGAGAARSAPDTSAKVVEHLRSAIPSFDELRSAAPSFDGMLGMPASMPAIELSSSDHASAFHEPAFHEPADNNAASNDAAPPDAPGYGFGVNIIPGLLYTVAINTLLPAVLAVNKLTPTFVRTRRWDAAIVPAIVAAPSFALPTADGGIDTEAPDWLRAAIAWHKGWSSSSE